MTSPRQGRGWLAGLVVGAAAGFLTLEFPSLGWFLAIAFAGPAAVVGPRLAAIGGLLTGLGGTWTVFIGRTALTCRSTGEELGCQAPGIEPWLAFGGGMLAVGLALSAIALARRAVTRRAVTRRSADLCFGHGRAPQPSRSGRTRDPGER
jgi:hypothetical protein